jgi:hypothetical protein
LSVEVAALRLDDVEFNALTFTEMSTPAETKLVLTAPTRKFATLSNEVATCADPAEEAMTPAATSGKSTLSFMSFSKLSYVTSAALEMTD